MSTGSYDLFNLDADGRDQVGDKTKLGLRINQDTDNVEPTTDTENLINLSAADETAGAGGTDQDPKLTITFDPVSAAIDEPVHIIIIQKILDFVPIAFAK